MKITSGAAANLFYDLNGNLTSDGTNSYTWPTCSSVCVSHHCHYRYQREKSAMKFRPKNLSYWLFFFFVFLLPFALMSLPWLPIPLRRLLAVSSLLFFLSPAIF